MSLISVSLWSVSEFRQATRKNSQDVQIEALRKRVKLVIKVDIYELRLRSGNSREMLDLIQELEKANQ